MDCSDSEEGSQMEDVVEYDLVLPSLFGLQMESIHSFYMENDVRFFFVKFKGKSFKNCKWLAEEEIYQMDTQAKAKLNRFVKDYEKRF